MRYAVNLYDWLEYFERPLSQESLLLKPIITRESVQAEGPELPDGDAVLVDANTSPERWNAICTILRRKHGKANRRLYESKTGNGGWKRV